MSKIESSRVEYIRQEHDYILDKLSIVAFNGKEYDFTGHYQYFTYEESIFGVPHGNIFVLDAVDYPTLLPIIGEERIKANFTRQDENVAPSSDGALLDPIIFDLNVYRMEGRQQDGGSKKSQTYTLSYISDLAFKNVSQRIFRSYQNKLYSDIVRNIYEDFLKLENKKLNIEPTKFDQNYIVQNDKPLSAIKRICSRAVSENDLHGSYYTFFEDRDSVNFVTISKLFDNPVKRTFRYDTKNVLENGKGLARKDREIEKDIYNVSWYHESNRFDVLESLQSGHGSSTLFTLDLTRRKYTKYDFDLNRDYDKFKHIDKSKKFTENSKMLNSPMSNVNFLLTNKDHNTVEHISGKDNSVRPYNFEEYYLLRNSQKMQLMKSMVFTTLSGDPTLRAGDVIEFMLPENLGKTSKEFPEELDKYLQGKYLIAGIQHIIKRNEYTINLDLIKESYFSDIEHRDPVKLYENVK